MLPNLFLSRKGESTLDFAQSRDFYLGVADTIRDGACMGLSLVWLMCRKKESLHTYLLTVRNPGYIGKIEHLYARDSKTRLNALTKLIRHMGWTDTKRVVALESAGMGLGVSAASVKAALAQQSGYLLCGFYGVGKADGHATALYLGPDEKDSCEYFDPNYGSARFPDRASFLDWFERWYWNAPECPGADRGCRQFAVDKMMPAEPGEFTIVPPPAVVAVKPVEKWDFKKGPPPPLSQRNK